MATAKLTIEVREDGKVYATGPLHDKNLCIAMLEEGINIVKTFKPGLIQPPGIDAIKKLTKEEN